MKKMKKLTALLLALAMILALTACNPNGSEESDAPSPEDPEGSAQVVSTDLEELGSGDVKWKEEKTSDGWIKIINEGGSTLGYSKDSGVALLQSDGFAFKDLNRNGALDPYEDWRLDAETRARNLANQMSGEEILPYLTHGGWYVFTTDKSVFASDDNRGYAYILGGGRAGCTRRTGSTTQDNVDHAIWVNMVQELCETCDYGIPAVVSTDPNHQAGMVESLSLAALMDPEYAVEVGRAYSEQYRAMGVHMLLGPQVDLMTTPVMDSGDGTFGEDPALSRDIADGFVSGLQSTWADDGTDMGWGEDSVIAVMKHYAGAGAGEGGRDDHNEIAKFAVFPSNNYEAHLIPYHDGAFDLSYSSTKAAGGVMMNFSVSHSKDGSLGELVGGAFSEFKYDTLFGSGWTGLVVSDWGAMQGTSGSWGMQDYTDAERIAMAIKLGQTQAGGYADLENMPEVWDILSDELGEDDATAMLRDRAYENLKLTFLLNLFENPYCSTDHVREVGCTEEALQYAIKTQMDSMIMLKNDGTIKQSDNSEKLTACIPYRYTYEAVEGRGFNLRASSWAPSVDLEVAAKYYNVVTDTPKDPSGPADDKGNPTYTENDIVRATAADIADCDIVLVGMSAPKTASNAITDESGNVTHWIPASIQYGEYTATTAKEQSIAGDLITETFNDGYTQQTVVTEENRSYKGQTAYLPGARGHLEALQYAKSIAGSKPVVVLMNQSTGSMVWSEVEPLANAILTGYRMSDEAFMQVAAGLYEPNGLLVVQMPASMEAVEAQAEDLPRDMECYVDSAGHAYDFAFGMNWSGIIDDDRVKTYSAAPLTKCQNIDFKYANE